MQLEHRMYDEMEVTVSDFFTTHHRFATETGIRGEFTFPALASHAVFRTSGGRELLMQKVHWLGSAHELVDGQVVRGTADKPSLLSRDIIIDFYGRQYLLAPEGVLSQGWYLDDARESRCSNSDRGVFSVKDPF